MRIPRRIALLFLGLCAAALVPTAVRAAKATEWQDVQGTSFKGEPVEVIGPFALFKTSLTTGRRMQLRGLSPENCQRFHRETAGRPARAATWAEARGAATRDVLAGARVVRAGELVPVDLATRPEPEVLVVLYGSNNDGESWRMVSAFSSAYARMERVFAGRLGGLFFGVRHDALQHQGIATGSGMPWLVADFLSQPRMKLLERFIPGEGPSMVALSRDGVALFAVRAMDFGAIRKFADDLAGFLAQSDPENPRGWPDRLHYLRAVRPLAFAQGETGPLLVGNPLRPDALRDHGITRVAARLTVGADGTVTESVLTPEATVPAELAAPLADALRRAVFLPAVDHGKTRAGTFEYALDVPPFDARAAADAAWLRGEARVEIPLTSWLLLKPIRVSEEDFRDDEGEVRADGTVVMRAYEASDTKVSRSAQLSAFHTDWFTAAGAGSVAPKAGDTQAIDGTTLTWTAATARDGLVNFRDGGANVDFSIGYAYTEFESPGELDAWLGLGSDDGVKIWCNGELVCDQWVRRPSRLDDDVVPLKLQPGVNRLLIKIQNATIDWSFVCRLRTRER